eukprot:m.53020 g.53020  ORF g.53020 m.53020 type:complete len:179 (-) comp9136_c0_seq4:115-651(-)
MSGAVWVVDPGEINLELFQCWLDGVPVEKAAAVRKDADGFGADVVLQDTVDEYRTFELLEVLSCSGTLLISRVFLFSTPHPCRVWATVQKYMQNPLQLATQTVITISSGTQQELLALYYAYDDAVMREILCNQLSKKIRNVRLAPHPPLPIPARFVSPLPRPACCCCDARIVVRLFSL